MIAILGKHGTQRDLGQDQYVTMVWILLMTMTFLVSLKYLFISTKFVQRYELPFDFCSSFSTIYHCNFDSLTCYLKFNIRWLNCISSVSAVFIVQFSSFNWTGLYINEIVQFHFVFLSQLKSIPSNFAYFLSFAKYIFSNLSFEVLLLQVFNLPIKLA